MIKDFTTAVVISADHLSLIVKLLASYITYIHHSILDIWRQWIFIAIGLFQKKSKQWGTGEGYGIWNFKGYKRNNMWNFQGLIKNKVEFPRVTMKKNDIRWNFPGPLFLVWNFQGILHNFLEYPGVEFYFVWNFQGQNEK